MQESDVYTSAADMHQTCMALAQLFAQMRSKDPNTRVGACVYDPLTGGLFLGYNGFPKGVPDFRRHWDNRDANSPESKYARVVHAEANAVRKAMQALGQLDRCTLYVTHYPCHKCMKDFIIPSGLVRVHFLSDTHFDPVSAEMAQHAGVSLVYDKSIELPVVNLSKGVVNPALLTAMKANADLFKDHGEPVCTTCGKTRNDPDADVCSNAFHF